MPVCRDDRRDLVADELVIGDAHDLDSTARLITTEWQRVAIPGRGPDPSRGLAPYRPLRPERRQLQVLSRPGAARTSRPAADLRSAPGTSGSLRDRPLRAPAGRRPAVQARSIWRSRAPGRRSSAGAITRPALPQGQQTGGDPLTTRQAQASQATPQTICSPTNLTCTRYAVTTPKSQCRLLVSLRTGTASI
jgi:hypothetical protein